MNFKEEFSKNTDPRLTKEQIKALKSDIIKFKKKHSTYRTKTWIKAPEREQFTIDYMKARDLNTDYSVYEQAVYIVMGCGWSLEFGERD